MKLSNLPPGVTDAMIEEQAQPEVERLLEELVAAVYELPEEWYTDRLCKAINKADQYFHTQLETP